MGRTTVKYKDAFTRGVYDEVHRLDQYVREIHESLKRSHAILEQQTKQDVAKARDEEAQQDIAIAFLDPEHDLLEVFPAMFSSATFVSIFSFFEHEMFSLCKRLQRIRNYTATYRESDGKGIDQAAAYLEKVCGLTKVKSIRTWEEVKRLQEIRNVIVHRRGEFREEGAPDDEDGEIRKYVEKRTDIKIDADNTLLVTKEFCFHVTGVVRQYLLDLIAKMPDTDTYQEWAR